MSIARKTPRSSPASVTRDDVIAGRFPPRHDLLAHCVPKSGLLRLVLLEYDDLAATRRLEIIVTDEPAIDGLVDTRRHAVGALRCRALANALDHNCLGPDRDHHIACRLRDLV